MRLITRNDASLSIALIAASVILFRQPLRDVLDGIRAIETRFHLDFLPALMLLIVAFSFHEYRKRLQMRAEAMAAEADAARARRQAATLQQLVALSQALGHALDRTTLQQALWQQLPLVTGDRPFWMLLRHKDAWALAVNDAANDPRDQDTLEIVANRALGGSSLAPASGAAISPLGAEVADSDVCFPLLVGGAVVGVLGVRRDPPMAADQQASVAAAAAMIATACKNLLLFEDAREMSVRDALTGCFNRAHALEVLEGELRRARRTGGPLSVLMFDVDNFKGINDRLGHLAGDELLQAIGTQLARTVRRTDTRCRYGGDEFLLVLPETPTIGAQQVAESVRQAMSAIKIGGPGPTPTLTLSIGIASAVPGEVDPQAIIRRADGALYQAKHAGRNRAVVAKTPDAVTIAGEPERARPLGLVKQRSLLTGTA